MIVSAYYTNPQEMESSIEPDCDELKYDRLDFDESADKVLIRILGTDTMYDLRTGFETIALRDDESMLEVVMNAIQVRDRDTKARLKRFHLGNVFSKAMEILELAGEEVRSEYLDKVNDAIEAITQLQFITKKPEDSQGNSLSNLRDALLSRTQIHRDIIVIDVTADTFSGSVCVPSFGYSVKHLNDQKKIVNMNFKFAIPERLYIPQNNAQKIANVETVQRGVKQLFEG